MKYIISIFTLIILLLILSTSAKNQNILDTTLNLEEIKLNVDWVGDTIIQGKEYDRLVLDTVVEEEFDKLKVKIVKTNYSTERFEIEVIVENPSYQYKDCFQLEKGLILAIDTLDAIKHNFQAIVICDIESKINYTEDSTKWVFCITEAKEIILNLKGFCLNRSFDPPNNGSTLRSTGLKMRLDDINEFCNSQKKVHDEIAKRSKYIFENELANGKSTGKEDDMEVICKSAIKNAIKNLIYKKYGYTLLDEQIHDFSVSNSCRLEYSTIIELEISSFPGPPDFQLTNFRGFQPKVNHGKMEVSFKCDGIDLDGFILPPS